MHLRNIAFLFGATILVLLWHLLMPSMLNSYHNSNDGMQDILNLHTTFPPFARRPLTTWAVKGTMLFFKCNASTGFTIINFLFLYLNGIIIYFSSLSGNNNSTQSILNSIAFYLSFSVFFSFFAPIYTYDEPIQYFCLLGAIYFLAQKKWFVYLLAMPFLWLSLVARETSVLLFPALYYLVLDEKAKENIDFFDIKTYIKGIDIPKSLVFSLPFVAYLCFNHWLFGALPLDKNRGSAYLSNIQSAQHFIESIVSAVLVLGIPCAILMKSNWRKQNQQNQNLFFIISITLIINTLVTFCFSFARESRIFALPLLLLFPIASTIFEPLRESFFSIQNLKTFLQFENSKYAFLASIIGVFGYHSTDSGGMNDYYRIYLGLTLFFIGYLYFLTKKTI